MFAPEWTPDRALLVRGDGQILTFVYLNSLPCLTKRIPYSSLGAITLLIQHKIFPGKVEGRRNPPFSSRFHPGADQTDQGLVMA